MEQCSEHPCSLVRDGECVSCHPLEEINLNGSPMTPSVLAAIADKLDRWGRVLVTNAAIPKIPGQSSFDIGRVFQAGVEALKDA